MKHFALLVLTALLLACSDSEQSSPEDAENNCDPLSFETGAPIELATVLAAGRDSAGAVYVVDETDEGMELRAFSGSEMILTQNMVSGSFGMNGGNFESFGVTVDVLPRSYLLLVEIEGDEVRMGRTFNTDGRLPAIADLSPSELLEIIDPEALEGAEVRGAAGEVEIEYYASAPSGELFLVIKPPNSEGYDDFRLFYGQQDALRERELISVTRARDGGSTHLIFELDGREADAFFPVDIESGQVLPGELSVEQDEEVVPLERFRSLADAERLESANFQCLG
jgi:hypothetical protein